MSYYLALVKLAEYQDRLMRARHTFRINSLSDVTEAEAEEEGALYLTERQMVNAQEMEAKLLVDVQFLEERLGLRRDQRWKKGSKEWKKAKEAVYMSKYHKVLDRLEGLIVSRVFELSKMNIAGTGAYIIIILHFCLSNIMYHRV